MNLRNILFLALTITFAACGGNSSDKKNGNPDAPREEVSSLSTPSEDMTSIQMQKWEISDFIYNDNGSNINTEKKPYLIFREGRASGFLGCNSFVGEYIEGANTGLNFNNIGLTKKRCKEGFLEEARVVELLNGANSYSLNEDKTRLTIKSTKGEIHLQLK
jgi:heat shock protein HslJ